MYKKNVKKNGKDDVNSCGNAVSLWDEAIADAKKMQQDAKMHVIRLKQAVKAFEQLRDSGVPFPSEQSEAKT